MNSTNQEAKLKTLPGPWSLGEMTGNWRDIDLPDHGGVMRIVWKMEDDEGRNDALEAQAHAVVAALNAAFSTPPAEQQAPNTGHAEADRLIGRLMSSDPDFEDCRQAAELIQREIKGPDGFGTWREAAIAERLARVNQQAAPKAAPGEPDKLMRDCLALLESFDYEDDEDSQSKAFFNAHINADWFFHVKRSIERQLEAKAAPRQEA